MDLTDIATAIEHFVRDNQAWAAPIVFLLCFGESLAFVSLMVPGMFALLGIGGLLGLGGISFWPVWIAGALGAALGDWVSFWVGLKFKSSVSRMWPLSRYPDLLPAAESFVGAWGVPSIFIGRFFGPLRAFVPLAAGIFEMPYWRFQFANFTSAFLWSAVVLSPGSLGIPLLKAWWGGS